jgi:hypothetical protein
MNSFMKLKLREQKRLEKVAAAQQEQKAKS